MSVTGVKHAHQPAVAQPADIRERLVAARAGILADQHVVGRRDGELSFRIQSLARYHDVFDVGQSLVGVEADPAAAQRVVGGFVQQFAVQRNPQGVTAAFELSLVPLPGGLVQTANPFDLVPFHVRAVPDQDRLSAVEVDVVVIAAVGGPHDEPAGQHALRLRFHQELGPQCDIRPLGTA